MEQGNICDLQLHNIYYQTLYGPEEWAGPEMALAVSGHASPVPRNTRYASADIRPLCRCGARAPTTPDASPRLTLDSSTTKVIEPTRLTIQCEIPEDE